MNEIKLRKIQAYTVEANVGDFGRAEKGIYSSEADANVKALNAGSYGEDGETKTKEVWIDNDDNLYTLQPLGKFIEVTADEHKKSLEAVKNKLTEAERKVLHL